MNAPRSTQSNSTFATKAAEDFTRSILTYHKELLTSEDEEARDAVIAKSIALIALAFGIPPIDGEPLDVDDAIKKLKISLHTIGLKSK